MPAFAAMSHDERETVIDHLIAEAWLFDDGGILSIGPEAERTLGWRNFMELTSLVTSEPEVTVRYAQTEIGRLPPDQLPHGGIRIRADPSRWPEWKLVSLDWRRGVANVVPDSRPGRSRWYGDARPLNARLTRRMRGVLAGADVSARLTRRGGEALARLRDDFWWAEEDATAIVTDARGIPRWWTFAGLRSNAELAARLGDAVRSSRARSNLSISLAEGIPQGDLVRQIRRCGQDDRPVEAADPSMALKFGQCLPPELSVRTAMARSLDMDSTALCLEEPVSVVVGERLERTV